jgi:amino acid transporter
VNQVYTRPNLLFTYLFSVLFVLLGGVQANALVFGKQVIVASSPGAASVDPRLQKFFAILIVTFVCQLQAFSRTMNVRVNNILAAFKLLMLSFIAVAGFLAIGGVRAPAAKLVGSEYSKENLTDAFTHTSRNWYGYSLALLNIVRAFLGYENANFVSENPGHT